MAHFDAEHGWLSPAVYSDPSIQRAELESIFRNSWTFLGPQSWLEQEGDYVATRMGNTPVLLWRGAAGVHLFLDQCLSCDRQIAPSRRGNADRLICECGRRRYSPEPSASATQPEPAGQTDRWCGLVFGCASDSAPGLKSAWGDFAVYAEAIAQSLPGGIEVIGNEPLVTRLSVNWKLGAEAWSGDLYRDACLTAATREALGEAPIAAAGFQAVAGAGAIVLAESDPEARGSEALAGMTPICATLFPNLSFDGRTPSLHVWHPLSATETEVHSYCLGGAEEAGSDHLSRLKSFQFRFGPLGVEMDDHEPVWKAITATSKGLLARAYPLNLQMGLGHERRSNLPGTIADIVSESNQRGFYSWWQAAIQTPAPTRPRKRHLRLVPPAHLQGKTEL